VIRKVLFLIGNKHFLIRKCHFGIRRGSYVERGQYANEPILFQELQMIRRRLLIVATVVASVVLAACSDMTAPTNDASCPVSTGSSTCK
jgi:hypothetical protein